MLSPFNEGTDILLDPSLGDNSTSFRMGDNLKWRKVGGIMDTIIIDRGHLCPRPSGGRSYLTNPSHPHTIWLGYHSMFLFIRRILSYTTM